MPGVKRQFITLDQEDQATEDFEGDVFSGEDQSGDDEEFDMGSASEEEEQQTSMMSLIKSGTGGKKALLRGPGSAAPVAKAKKATPQDLTAEDVNEDEETTVSIPVKKNKQRVLLLSSRGITYRFRHLLNDLSVLMPHSKRDTKLDLKGNLETLNELSELANCNNCVFFEIRKHSDLYLWLAKTPNGPSAKFLIQNIHTMDELKLTGNCLKGSRPLLSFDKGFDGEPHWRLVKEMLTQVCCPAYPLNVFLSHQIFTQTQ